MSRRVDAQQFAATERQGQSFVCIDDPFRRNRQDFAINLIDATTKKVSDPFLFPVSPRLIPLAILGSTAPDWMEWLARIVGHPVQHRGPTHWLAAWLLAFVIALTLPAPAGGLVAAFAWGGLCHVLADSLTVSGVPFSPYSERRFHLLGGRMRTGGAGEYGVSWGVVIVCWMLSGQLVAPSGGYLPFFPNWAERYDAGTATAKEWRENRFRFF